MEDLDPEAVLAFAREAKAMLRKRARGLRASIPAEAIARRSKAIVERLLSLDVVRDAKSVALFQPMARHREVDLRELDPALRARGANVFYPSIDKETRVMTFRAPRDPSELEERGMLAPEPDPSRPEAERLDVVVVPALLVDPRGYRLGFGGGFYDRALPRFCPPARSIAVAFEFQVAADLPVESWDVACDMIVTDAAIVKG